MGPRELMPPLPSYEWMSLPASQVVMGKCMQECNWVQAVEGDIDTSHAPILHGGEVLERTGRKPTGDLRVQTGRRPRPSNDVSPRLEVQNTDFGFHYAGIYKGREDPDHTSYVRIVPYIAPFLIYIPPNNAKFYVPIDDYHTWHYVIAFSTRRELSEEDRERVMAVSSIRPGKDVDEHFRHIGRNRENNYLQDRGAMKRGESWTGIVGNGVVVEDMAVTETMGPIYDRSREHLGARDIAIIRMRRLLLDSVHNFQDGGAPLGLDRPLDYPHIRSWHGTIPADRPWQEMVPGHVILDQSDVEVSV
jgi:phthalate 4,5-dioxygenase oxygenase subunit